jgi:alpha-glucosidase
VTRGAWWRDSAVYQVYVRSFADSDADGIGDLDGVRSRLPYLARLGVDAIWLTPFYPSPQHDGGYDVADYFGIEPALGTLTEFRKLVGEAHDAGLRVLVDIVPNHCSIQHSWFREALAAGPGSEQRARFHFTDGRGPAESGPPNNWRSMFGGSTWERVPDGQWYLHLFTRYQPDFNWRNPAVARYFARVIEFWLNQGVDGFRVDAAQGLFKDRALIDSDDPGADERIADAVNPRAWNQPEVHDIYRSWRRLCDAHGQADGVDRVLVGEVTGTARESIGDYLRPGELHQAFFFDLLVAPWDATEFARSIRNGLAVAAVNGTTPTWVLGNHDRTRIATRYGGGAPGSGQGDLRLGSARALAAFALVAALPGSLYIYQGEELCLPEVVDLPETVLTDPIFHRTGGVQRGRDGCRVPIPWQADAPSFGFSPPGAVAP